MKKKVASVADAMAIKDGYTSIKKVGCAELCMPTRDMMTKEGDYKMPYREEMPEPMGPEEQD